MSFVHEDPEFERLLDIVARSTAIAAERAYAQIAPMFWGPRIPLDTACAAVRAWLTQLDE